MRRLTKILPGLHYYSASDPKTQAAREQRVAAASPASTGTQRARVSLSKLARNLHLPHLGSKLPDPPAGQTHPPIISTAASAAEREAQPRLSAGGGVEHAEPSGVAAGAATLSGSASTRLSLDRASSVASIQFSAVDLLKDPSAEDALLPDGQGEWARQSVTVKQALDLLDRTFPGQAPGEMSALLRQIERDDLPLSAEAVCAIVSSKAFSEGQVDVPRSLVEAAMVAQWQTDFMWARDETLTQNMRDGTLARPPNRGESRAMAKAEVDFCFKAGHISKDDRVLVFGAGMGDFAAALEGRVKEVVAIEPGIEQQVAKIQAALEQMGETLPDAERRQFEKILPLTGEQFVEQHPDKKFTVVIASNCHFFLPEGVDPERAIEDTMASMASMTDKGGKTLLGVPSTHPSIVKTMQDGQFGSTMFQPPKVHLCSASPHFTNYRKVSGQICFMEYPRLDPLQTGSAVQGQGSESVERAKG